MSILSDFETRLGDAVEGAFGAMFRSPVQPAELARAASKEMTRSRKLGVDKQYVANVYFVFIGPRDADTFGGLVHTLEGELETYLLAFARERDFALITRPVVRFSVDEKLKRQGKFDVIGEQMSVADIYEELGSVNGVTDDLDAGPVQAPVAEYVQAPQVAVAPEPTWAEGTFQTPTNPPAQRAEVAPLTQPVMVRRASLVIPGSGEMALDSNRTYVVGRQKECDICLDDANISRRHAEFYCDGGSWSVRDLDSTNGVRVNGRPQKLTTLLNGDEITMGVSNLQFFEKSRMEHA